MGKIAFFLIISLILWSIGAPTLLKRANASTQITSASDTLTQSGNSQGSRHLITFTNTSNIGPNSGGSNSVSVTFDPAGANFSEVGTVSTSTNFSFIVSGAPYGYVASCAGAASTFTVAANNYNGGSNEGVTFQNCSSSVIATSSIIQLGIGATSTPVITNPAATGSYIVRIGGTSGNTGDMQVAVLPNVTVTAAVNTTFTFTVGGVATSTVINGIPTTGTDSTTTLPFGVLTPNASSTLGQTLAVTTNAQNGFQVTVQENQPLTSSTGAIIYLFANGASTTVPTAWVNPSSTLNQPWTYGEFGVTSDDSILSTITGTSSNDFTSGKFAGNLVNPRVVFANNGPSDGITQNYGLAHVAYTIEVGSLQAAANDYTNTLTYVATPTF